MALSGLCAIGVQTPANIPAGSVIVVSGFRSPLSYLNGTYIPNVSWYLNGGSIVLTHKPLSVGQQALYNSGAWVRVAAYSYPNITSLRLVGPRWRETGRDFFVRRGRRSK